MSSKHLPPAPSFSSGILDIPFLRLWEVMSEFTADCCACFPTCSLLFLSKPQASCGAQLYLCYLLHSLAWQGSALPELAFPALWGEWTLQSPAGAWCRYLAQDGGSEWVRPSPLVLWLVRAACWCLWNHSLRYCTLVQETEELFPN